MTISSDLESATEAAVNEIARLEAAQEGLDPAVVDEMIAAAQADIDARLDKLRADIAALGNVEPPVVTTGLFPSNHFWNTKINKAPLNPRSADLMANFMHAGHPFHPDWGDIYDGHKWGIPINIVGNSTPRVHVGFREQNYQDESDPMPPE